MFMQKTTPNQIGTTEAGIWPRNPISSTGRRVTIGRNTGMTSSTMPTQSIRAPSTRKMTIIIRITPMVGRSAPTIKLAT